jgi:trans-2,3-dihydro-3-hydroxyanthranilate isomerase
LVLEFAIFSKKMAATTCLVRKFAYVTCDVFASKPFGGNQLAVVFDDEGALTTEEMQQLACEFNYAETSFVRPPIRSADFGEAADADKSGQDADDGDAAIDANVRIFTPVAEMPFAGHPNVGTAAMLLARGKVLARELPSLPGSRATLRFRERAGIVPLVVERDATTSALSAELTAPEQFQQGVSLDPADVAACVGLESGRDLDVSVHPPVACSCGAEFLFARLSSREALQRALPDPASFAAHLPLAEGNPHGLLLYYVDSATEGEEKDKEKDDVTVWARMFAPEVGVVEDAATGSAAVALISLLAAVDPRPTIETMCATIHQGIEMGRPSQLYAKVIKVSGRVTESRVRGFVVPMMSGEFEL